MTRAVYPGSLDPVTFGHVGAIRDTAAAFGGVVVAIGVNPAKTGMFSLSEREDLVRHATAGIDGVEVTAFSGLLVHFLVRNNLDIVVRGVRNGQDLDDAMLQETIGWQQTLARDIKAFYVPARPGQAFTSSTALKAVLKEQGDATHLAPLSTIHATQARMMGQYFYGVTGMSGSGKSSVCRAFADIAAARGIPLIHVDMDKIAHAILSTEQDPLYVKIRHDIAQAFGGGILDDNGFIVRKKLGEVVFGNPDKLKILNDIIHPAVFFRMSDMLRGKKGIFLIDTALLAETDKTSLVNNRVLLVDADADEVATRLQKRDNLSPEQLSRRMASQFNTAAKAEKIEQNIASAHYGRLDRLKSGADADIEQAFDRLLQNVDIYGELRITSFLKNIGVVDADDGYASIRKLYGGNDRFYHTLSRVVAGLDDMPALDRVVADKPAFMLAWLFRDAAGAGRASESSDIMKKFCRSWGVDDALVMRAEKLLTDAAAPDAALLADLSLASLGAGADDFDRAENNLRREYNAVSATDWRYSRAAALRALPHTVFKTAHFQEKYGAKAQENIARYTAAAS